MHFSRAHAVSAALLAIALGACSSDDTEPPGPTAPAGGLLLQSPDFMIPPGETLHCTYTDTMLPAAMLTREIHSFQMRGGHHAVLFYTTSPKTPGTYPCSEEEMTNWRFIGGGQESSESALSLPEGIAIRIPEGLQLVIQSHYLNVDSEPRMVHDALTITPVAESEIENVVDAYNMFDADLAIPPRGDYGRTLTCTAEQEMHIVSMLGHTHGYGTRVRIEVLPPVDAAGEGRMMYDEEGGDRLQFNPPVYTFAEAGGVVVPSGGRIRLTCDWMNTTTDTLRVPQEMCASLMYYYPSVGPIVCDAEVTTRGGVVDPTMPMGNGNGGCETPPAVGESCVRPCNTGNEQGVGEYCTPGGNECARNRGAFVCTADVDTSGLGFCTKPCTSDDSCGSGSVCTGDERGMGCVPVECVAE